MWDRFLNSAYSSFVVNMKNIFLKAAKCSTLAQGNKGEVNELRTIVQNYENIIDYVNKSYTEKLLQKVNAKCDVEIDRVKIIQILRTRN